MWVLLMISLSGVHSAVFLEKYITLEECQSERIRIAQEMAISYPLDVDMQFVCRYREHST